MGRYRKGKLTAEAQARNLTIAERLGAITPPDILAMKSHYSTGGGSGVGQRDCQPGVHAAQDEPKQERQGWGEAVGMSPESCMMPAYSETRDFWRMRPGRAG